MSETHESATTVRTGADGSRVRPSETDAWPPGTEIGRYVALGVAGRGATGVVYRAYDPELDRRVALKVLVGRGGEHEGGERSEVLREARALARLRHPNVVTVYDVGEHAGSVWVAMEFLDGRDLARFTAERPRPWPLVAKIFAAAGRGLAAAHAAEIIHRDFKPSNVVVGDRGEVWVVDFGLARDAPSEDAAADSEAPDASSSHRPPGTPAYLAPELYAGHEADVRSDLYAFCVALWESIFGARPWDAPGEAALLLAKEGPLPPLPSRPRLPRTLSSLLRAGLSADPAGRPPDLQPLLTALEAPSRRKRSLLLGAASIAAAGAAWAALGPVPCDRGADRIAQVWNDTSRKPVQEGLAKSGISHPDRVWDRTAANVDAWAEQWTTSYRDACEATHHRREQSEALLDRRMACLDRDLAKLDALLQELHDPTSSVAAEGPRAVAKLAAALACDRTDVEQRSNEPIGAEREALQAELDRIDVLELLAQYEEALQAAKAARARAEAIETSPEPLLQVRYRIGRLLDLTGDARGAADELAAVHWAAEAAGVDTLAAKAGIYVLYEHAAVFKRPDDAFAWVPHVRAAITRAGDHPLDRAALVESIGVAELYRQQPEAAIEALTDSLRLRESAPGDTDLAIVSSLGNLGVVYEEAHRYDEAIAAQARALEILRRRVGEDHPHYARVLDNLGTARLRAGQREPARELFEEARRIRTEVFGARHRSVALSWIHLGLAAIEDDDADAAIAAYGRALEIYAESSPGAHEVLICHEGLAHAHAAKGELESARRHAETALAGLAGRLPEDHPEIRALREIIDAPVP